MSYSLQDWQSGVRPPKGWDVADAVADGWTREDVDGFMRLSVRPWPDVKPEPPLPDPEPDRAPERESAARQAAVPQAKATQQEEPATVVNIQTRQSFRSDDGWMAELVCNEEGKTKPNVTKNWALFLENHHKMRGVLAFDAFKMRIMLMKCPPWEWRQNEPWEPRVLKDTDYSEAVMWLESFQMTPKASNIAAVIDMVAHHNSFDRLDEYLSGLKWDGKARVRSFLTSCMGADDSDYHRTVATRWLVSAVARALRPGCKVDTMPVFEGPQGALKSAAIKALFGPEFSTDGLSDIGSKDAMMEMAGVWCIEVAEMHRLNASGSDQVKKFLSVAIDRYRPPYGRNVIEAPRRSLLAGTMNPEGNPYFKDTTGARRFWPVVVGKVNIGAIERDRDQIWAEATRMFLDGAQWWVQPDEQQVVEEQQEKRIDVDVWTAIIAPALVTRGSISQWEVFNLVGIPQKDAGVQHATRVGRIMKRLGWEARRDRAGGEDRIIYLAPEGPDGEVKDDLPW